MHIGLVRRGYSPTGGAEAYLKRFARALLEAGHACTLFTSTQWPDWPGERIVRLPGGSPLDFAAAVRAARRETPCDTLFSLERVWECDAYRAGDGVHRAWLARRDAVEPFWKRWTRGLNPKHRQLLALEKRLFSTEGAGRIIANCRMVRNEIVRTYGYPAERISVIYNGLPAAPAVEPGLRERERARLGLGADDFAVLFAGSGWERKGLRTAVEGIAQVRGGNPVLLVAGKGNPRAFRGGGGRVRFLGPVRGMAACYAAADLFVLPTLYDPFSNACLEALAAGLPVVTTASNGFSEILAPGETGEVLADPRDAAACARAIEAWADPTRRAAVRPRLLKLAAGFTIEANVAATLEVLGLGVAG